MSYLDDSPIIACSTSTQSNAAIAVIRISGLKNFDEINIFFNKDLNLLRPRFAEYCGLVDEKKIIDNVVLLYFAAPASYNGENILEISVHGNQINVQRILDLFLKKTSIKLAAPGEFTYRALKNKKLSLNQVEGLDLLLNANSNALLDHGLKGLLGGLGSEYKNLYDNFIKLKAALELSIDFLDDVGEEAADKLFQQSLAKLKNNIDNLYARTQSNVSELLAPEVILIGKRNAGKSSLFNIIIGNSRSIVSNIAGTTRDYISEYFFYAGVNYKLLDTAGLKINSEHGESNVIEDEGIKRGLHLLSNAFFKILVINPFDFNESLLEIKLIEFDCLIFTHSDVTGFTTALLNLAGLPNFKQAFYTACTSFDVKNGPIGPEKEGGSIGPLQLKNASGPIEPLLKMTQLLEIIEKKYSDQLELDPIIVARQRSVIAEIYKKFSNFSMLAIETDDVGVILSELAICETSIASLIGVVSADNVLDEIFSNFCIGK